MPLPQDSPGLALPCILAWTSHQTHPSTLDFLASRVATPYYEIPFQVMLEQPKADWDEQPFHVQGKGGQDEEAYGKSQLRKEDFTGKLAQSPLPRNQQWEPSRLQ